MAVADAGAVRERLEALRQRREELNAARRQIETLLPTLSDPELVSYFNRVKLFGDWAAVQWLVQTRGGP